MTSTKPPTITGDDDPSFREESTGQVARYQATDPERDDITWSVSGVDVGAFDISDSGVLTFHDPPDYENPTGSAGGGNEYRVAVEAEDEGHNVVTFAVMVTVTPVNEPPTVAGDIPLPLLPRTVETFSLDLHRHPTRRRSPPPPSHGASRAPTVVTSTSIETREN